jgi:hypothetical protein
MSKGDKRIKELKDMATRHYEISDYGIHNINPYMDTKTWLFIMEDETIVIAQQWENSASDKQGFGEVTLSKEDGLKNLYEAITETMPSSEC